MPRSAPFASRFAFALAMLAAITTLAPAFAEDVPDLRARTTGSDWPTFLGPASDGKSTETDLLFTWPEGGPPVAWHRQVGEGYSTVSTSKGRLFVFDGHGKAGEGGEGLTHRLSCLNAETGEEIWHTEQSATYEDYYGYSTGPKTVPVVDGERVFTFGIEGTLRAQRVTDGEILWQVDTEREFGVVKNFFGVGSTPVVEGDLLIVPIGGSPPESPKVHSGEVKGNGSGIVAFDKATGKVRWKFSDRLASYATPVLGTIDGERWGFAFTRGGLLGFDPKKGAERFFFPWRAKKLESVNAATPVVVGDTVFITESYGPGGALVRVAPDSEEGHEVVWTDPPRGKAMESHWSTPVYHEGHLYGSSGQSRGNAVLRCLDHGTGKVRWEEPGLTRSTLLYADGHFIVLTEEGQLLAIEATPEALNVVSRIDLGDSDAPGPKDPVTKASSRPLIRHPAWNAPVLSHGYLYVRGRDQLIAFDLARPTKAPESSSP